MLGAQSLNQARLAKLLTCGACRFRDAIGLQHEDIARGKLHVCRRALPLFKQPQHSCGSS